jgi:hypothetical protein
MMFRICSVAALAFAAISVASAQVFFNENFEAPQYSVGALAGQATTTGPLWQTGGARWTVSNNRAFSGTQSIFVNGTSGVWAWPDLPGPFTGGTNPTLLTSVMLFLPTDTGAATNSLGLFSWSQGPGGSRTGGIRFYKNGNVETLVGTTFTVAQGVTAPRDQWFEVALAITYSTPTSAILRTYMNGTQIGPNQNVTLNTISVDLYAFDATGAAVTANFDDYRVVAVPEPATLAVFGLGLVAFARRRRKQ